MSAKTAILSGYLFKTSTLIRDFLLPSNLHFYSNYYSYKD